MSEQLRHDNPDNRCQHTSAAGRRCRMPRMQGDASFCYQHRWQLQPQTHPETVAAELLGSIQDFKTATAVNQALRRLFTLVAGNRIPPRHAAVLAYIAQLLFTTLPYVKSEITCTEGYDAWEHALGQALRNLRRSKPSRLAQTALKQITQVSSQSDARLEHGSGGLLCLDDNVPFSPR